MITLNDFIDRHELTRDQAAALFRVHRATIFRWLDQGPPPLAEATMNFFDNLPERQQQDYLWDVRTNSVKS